MLVQFTLENWLSFRDRTTLSMVASRERRHSERLARIDRYQTRLLPTAALFGGNASGKTNLVKGLSFARWMIVHGPGSDGRIPRRPFLLDKDGRQKPSRFEFEMLIEDQLYEYSFACDDRSVTLEKLVHVRSKSEITLFERSKQIVVEHQLSQYGQLIEFISKGVGSNQLLLANSVFQQVDEVKHVYDWFRVSLVLFPPNIAAIPVGPFFEEEHPFHAQMCELLSKLDSGITRIESRQIDLDQIPVPNEIKMQMMMELKENESFLINGEFTVGLDGDGIVAKQLSTNHRNFDGDEVRFAVEWEADGTKRAIDLLPAFLDLASDGSTKVCVFDEIDRSLHTILVWNLIESFLSGASKDARAQLLFTTHDLMLMDQRLFRRDEMWFTERDRDGASTLVSFSEFKDARPNTDIRKVYLGGRTGGVPRIWIDSEDLRRQSDSGS